MLKFGGKNKTGDGAEITEAQVLDSMRHIIDPDLGKDIVALGFIKNLQISDRDVKFTVELTTPACPVKEHFKTECEKSVKGVPGVRSVHVTMSAQESKRPGSNINTLNRVNAVIAVSSCKGGVGKSTVSAQLARALAQEGLRVGLLDTDIYGPSLPTLFNMHRPQLQMRGDMLIPLEVDGIRLMSVGFVLGDSPAVLRGPMVSGYCQQILQQTDWGDLDYLIIDMPPGTGDIQLTLVQQAALDGAIIVTTPHSLSLVDVSRGILMFEKVNVPVLGVVENMSYFECDGCGKKHHLFGNSAQKLRDRFGLSTLAEFPLIDGMSRLDKPTPPDAIETLASLCDSLHREIGKRRAEAEPLPEVHADPGFIRVQWPDGQIDRLPSKVVRASCQCAQCVDEFTGEKLLDPNTIPDQLQAQSVDTLGNYAVSIAWNDGHSSGIFTWEHLRELTQGAGV